MKLLFDQNLSHKLVRALADLFPDCAHVRQFGLKEAEDPIVWDFARSNGYVIVSKDHDFHQRSFLYGHPPKVVWVRLGNCSTRDVENCIRAHAGDLGVRSRPARGVPRAFVSAWLFIPARLDARAAGMPE